MELLSKKQISSIYKPELPDKILYIFSLFNSRDISYIGQILDVVQKKSGTLRLYAYPILSDADIDDHIINEISALKPAPALLFFKSGKLVCAYQETLDIHQLENIIVKYNLGN